LDFFFLLFGANALKASLPAAVARAIVARAIWVMPEAAGAAENLAVLRPHAP